jgi:transcriptional regulator with XRE-family HTH domain
MTSLKTIGGRIAEERRRQNLTQEDLSGMAEIDRSMLSYIENGRQNFSMELFLRLAAALKKSPAHFLE